MQTDLLKPQVQSQGGTTVALGPVTPPTHPEPQFWARCPPRESSGHLLGAVMGGPAHDEVMKKIPGRQGHLGPHP